MARILLLMGGDAPEREISLRSGRAVAKALARNGHQVWVFDISFRHKNSFPTEPIPPADPESLLLCSPMTLPYWLSVLGPNAVFPVLHGGYGEDGTLQAMLELFQVPYASPPPLACQLAMNKVQFKRVIIAEGIATPIHCVVENSEFECDFEATIDKIENSVGYPCVIKPSSQGSTIGASVVNQPDRKALREALAEAFSYDSEVLVERKIIGKEITVAVLGSKEKAKALPVIEIVPKESDFFDFKTKYTPGMADHRIPPTISEEAQKRAQEIAVKVHNLLGCRAVTRTDMIVDGEENIFVLELNAIPGMTEISLVPEAAKAAGISFEALMEILLEEALQTPLRGW
ncbi:MAG: D-alanine--D-alanine ligase [Armatimonadetes bacterium]|nr:D-alanine--D-alanine ligase [Armatimonadota bacterium]MDW8026917.1 D-alanine--D-alanine ligase [Armatimonadota bacterium]